MAVLATTLPTLNDVASRTDPNGNISMIAEILTEMNPVLEDAAMEEGNLQNGYQASIRTGLPTPTWRRINRGVRPTKSTTGQVVFTCGTAEDYAEVDKELAELNGNAPEFMMSDSEAHIEGMNQEIATKMFYGSEEDEEEAFTGLSHYFSDKSAESGDNIIDAGGTGTDNYSIWLVVWGRNRIFCTYPKGSKAGLQHEDMGLVVSEVFGGNTGSPDGGRLRVYRQWFQWKLGLVVKDWRYAVRIANIDISELSKNYSTGAELQDLMVQAAELPHDLNGRACFYMNRTLRTTLRRQILSDKKGYLSWEKIGGKRVMLFDDIPIKRCDALHTAEARVT